MSLASSYVSNRSINVGARSLVRNLSALWTQTWTNPAAGSITAYLTTSAGPNTATFTYYRTGQVGSPSPVFDGTLAAGIPDYPRNVVITVTHASAVVALSGVISGADEYGRNMSEAWSVTAGTTSKTFTGTKGFARVDNVTVVAASDASADTVKIGTGNVFGIGVNNAVASAVKEVSGGSVVTNGTLLAKSTSATADQRGTYSPNTTPNGATTYTIWIISDDPERSSDA